MGFIEKAKYRQSLDTIPLGGRLFYFKKFWQTITNNKEVLDIVDGLCIPFECIYKQAKFPHQIKMDKQEKKFIDDKITELLRDKCISEISFDPVGWISNIFLCNKKSGGKQMILSLKHLHSPLPDKSFKMEHITDAQRLVIQNSWMITLDVSNAYSHLGFKPQHQTFLQWKNKIYKFTTLANNTFASIWTIYGSSKRKFLLVMWRLYSIKKNRRKRRKPSRPKNSYLFFMMDSF